MDDCRLPSRESDPTHQLIAGASVKVGVNRPPAVLRRVLLNSRGDPVSIARPNLVVRHSSQSPGRGGSDSLNLSFTFGGHEGTHSRVLPFTSRLEAFACIGSESGALRWNRRAWGGIVGRGGLSVSSRGLLTKALASTSPLVQLSNNGQQRSWSSIGVLRRLAALTE